MLIGCSNGAERGAGNRAKVIAAATKQSRRSYSPQPTSILLPTSRLPTPLLGPDHPGSESPNFPPTLSAAFAGASARSWSLRPRHLKRHRCRDAHLSAKHAGGPDKPASETQYCALWYPPSNPRLRQVGAGAGILESRAPRRAREPSTGS